MKRLLLATLPLLVIMALAGCGSPDDGTGIATAGGTASPDGAGDGASGEGLSDEERHEMALEFAACMREHGIDMEDPEQGEGIRIEVRGDPEQADAAMEECRHLRPNDGGPAPEDDQEAREQMLALAQCMRDNGVESFADPEQGQGIRIGPEQAEDPDFQAAQEKCNQDVLGGQPDTTRNGGGQG